MDLGPNGRYGSGVFRKYSRINLSCRRDVHDAYNPTLGKETVHAIRDIKAGEEPYVLLPRGVWIRKERRDVLRKHWWVECKCEGEVCEGSGMEVFKAEQRRERLDEIERGFATYERQKPCLTALAPGPVPRDDAEALTWCGESFDLLKEEGPVGVSMADAQVLPHPISRGIQRLTDHLSRYRSCSKSSLRCGQPAKALAYARKELEIEKGALAMTWIISRRGWGVQCSELSSRAG